MRILVRYTDNTEEWLEDVMSPDLTDGLLIIESTVEELTYVIPYNSVKSMRIVGKARL